MNQQDKDRLREIAKDYEDFDLGALILSLLEENEALARDAARYRWLRGKPLDWNVEHHRHGWATYYGHDELDGAIDAAMQPKGE